MVIPTFLGITMLVFFITRFVPGGPIERMISQSQQMNDQSGGRSSDNVGSHALSQDQIKELEKFYGFDQPVHIAYVVWLGKVLTLDLGISTRYNEPVWDIIKTRFPISIFYGLTTLILSYLICLPLGITKALKHKGIFDNLTSIVIFIGYAIPGYVVGVIVLVVFAANLGWFPLGGFVGDNFEELSFFERIKDIAYHAALPLIAYMTPAFAGTTILMKNTLMENLASDYVRTAIAKGVSFNKAVFRHAIRNSLIPLATHIGNSISVILMGSFLIEKIFNINGFGLLGFESIVERDYPVVLGILVMSSMLFLIGNILSDIAVAFVDPRVRFR